MGGTVSGAVGSAVSAFGSAASRISRISSMVSRMVSRISSMASGEVSGAGRDAKRLAQLVYKMGDRSMNYEPLEDFYCIPQSEEEAKEIVERAVAHGVLTDPLIRDEFYSYDMLAWGVFGGVITVDAYSFCERRGIKELSIYQLRKECPFVSELYVDEYLLQSGPRPEYIKEKRWNSVRRAMVVAGSFVNGVLVEYRSAIKKSSGFAGFITTSKEDGIVDQTPVLDVPNEKEQDEVNNPSHYASGDIECIDAIRASMTQEEFLGYCKGNVIKYNWRWRDKGGKQSLEEAQWYQARMIEELSK